MTEHRGKPVREVDLRSGGEEVALLVSALQEKVLILDSPVSSNLICHHLGGRG